MKLVTRQIFRCGLGTNCAPSWTTRFVICLFLFFHWLVLCAEKLKTVYTLDVLVRARTSQRLFGLKKKIKSNKQRVAIRMKNIVPRVSLILCKYKIARVIRITTTTTTTWMNMTSRLVASYTFINIIFLYTIIIVRRTYRVVVKELTRSV